MKETSRQVLASIIELAILKDSRKIKTPWAGLRLRATFREDEDLLLQSELDNLRDVEKLINSWTEEGESVSITISGSHEIPTANSGEKDAVSDRAIRRALIFKLYEEYRKSGNLSGQYPLVQLRDILETSQEEILRHIDYLENEYYLEYKVMNGGMGTSGILHHGIKLCESKSELFSILGTIQVSTKEKDEDMPAIDEDAKRRVFVVHGRNEKARKAMFTFLRSLSLEPIEWSEAITYTETGAPYIGDILDHAFKRAQAIVVLITGDDISKLSSQYLKSDDPPYEREFMPQARPNVLFEAGLAFGRHSDRTILVELGPTRPFSDIAGRHIVRISNDAKARQELVTRLKTAGCNVKTEAKIDWLHEGDFDAAHREHDDNMRKEIQGFETLSYTKTIAPLGKWENQILKFIVERGDKGFRVDELSNNFSLPIVRLQYHLDQLVSVEYLHTLLSVGGPTIYKLTQKGRAYVVEKLDDQYEKIVHDIISAVKKMRGIGKKPTPREIATTVGLNVDTILSHLKGMHDALLITFYTSEGLQPDSELILGEKSFEAPFI
jgi:predicted nucleotide-binding protein/predicted ArsR family transcriptional regulator